MTFSRDDLETIAEALRDSARIAYSIPWYERVSELRARIIASRVTEPPLFKTATAAAAPAIEPHSVDWCEPLDETTPYPHTQDEDSK